MWRIFLLTIFLSINVLYGIPLEDLTNEVPQQNRINTEPTTEQDKSQSSPPHIFPSDPQKYKILKLNNVSLSNDSAIKILLERERKQQETNSVPKLAEIQPTPSSGKRDVTTADLSDDVGYYQPNDTARPKVELEEQYHMQPSANLRVNEVFAEDIETNEGPKLHEGHVAAIVAGILAVLCIGVYIGLIVWRSYLEKRYGMRERLVTQDDYYNNNDIRHFDL